MDKEKVIQAIQARHEAGLPMTGVRNRDPSLFEGANRHFGCWGKAVTAAGLTFKPRKSWTAEKVLQEIRARKLRGLQLRNMGEHDNPLACAAQSYFGGWRKALEAAGVAEEGRR